MTKSATDVMQEVIFAAVIDSIMALKAASKGLPNTLLRDLNAVHQNTTFADLPQELQAAITTSVRSAFTRLLKEGYSVSPGRPAPSGDRPFRREGGDRPPRPGGGPGGGPGGPNRDRRDRPGERRPPRNGGRPNRGPNKPPR